MQLVPNIKKRKTRHTHRIITKHGRKEEFLETKRYIVRPKKNNNNKLLLNRQVSAEMISETGGICPFYETDSLRKKLKTMTFAPVTSFPEM